MEPLRRIDFGKLVSIYDHEEHFLEQTSVRTLEALRSGRAPAGPGRGEINA